MNPNYFLIVCILFGSALASTTPYNATKTTFGTVGAEGSGGSCIINGASTELVVANGYFMSEIYTYALLGFDFTSLAPTTTVSSATLNLTSANSMSQNGYTVYAWNVTNNWFEANFSYTGVSLGCSVQPTVGTYSTSATTDANGNLLLDITSYVSYCVQNSLQTSLRLDLNPSTFAQLDFGSRRATKGFPVAHVTHN